MSLNDMSLGVAKGADAYPGIINPTAHSNVLNPLATNMVRRFCCVATRIGLSDVIVKLIPTLGIALAG